MERGHAFSMTGYGWLAKGFHGEEGMRGEKSEKWQQEVDERVTLPSSKVPVRQ